MILRNDIIEKCKPGDILLTANPASLGKLINFGQGLEDAGKRKSKYGHVAIFAEYDAMIFESVMKISKNSINNYHEQDVCIIRHNAMTVEKFYQGRKEILDNLGQIYPFHRLIFHGLDMFNSWIKRVIFKRKKALKFRYMKFMPLDWPVCSELAAQFLHKAGLEGGWEDRKKGWRGVNPDDFDDARFQSPTYWTTILEDQYIDINKIK